MTRVRHRLKHTWPAMILTLIAVAAGIAIGELAAALARAQSAIVTVGATIIDATPTPLKEFAVREFGTADKTVLLSGIGLGIVVLALVLGALADRRPAVGVIGIALFGAAGAALALARPAAQPRDLVPPIAGAIAGAAFLLVLLNLRTRAGDGTRESPGRRTLLTAAGAVAVAGIGGYAASRAVQRAGAVGEQSRAAVRLPAPASPAPPLPEGAAPAGPFHTPNADFYRVDTALTVPQMDAGAWTLTVGGRVGRERTYTFADLLARPLIERDVTLVCVSNEVGGPYLGTARWLGVPLADLLAESGVDADADQVVSRSVDGMTIGTPTRAIMDGRDAMLAVGMNGEPLPLRHGFPVRMLVPGLYGYVSACKWVTEIELSRFDDFDPYWVRRDWAVEAPIKTSSRIDTPKALGRVAAGTVRVAGVAWAPHRGISLVEVRVDGGEWRRATLAPVPSTDTWRQWYYDWDATRPGRHDVQVRATDGAGAVQVEERATPFPSGATGWHSIAVRVE